MNRKATPAVQQRLEKLGLRSTQDIVLHLPLRYEDETRITPIAQMPSGRAVLIEATVEHCAISPRPRRQLIARLQDDSGTITARWLNFYPSLQKQLQTGSTIRLFGEQRHGAMGAEMVHPRLLRRPSDGELPHSLTPVYPTVAGLGQATLRKHILQALHQHSFTELLPADICHQLHLPSLNSALTTLHSPPADIDQTLLLQHRHPAWQRIKLEELLVQQISLRRAYLSRRQKNAPALADHKDQLQQLCNALPFTLTAAQQRVWDEIIHDLAQPHPMQRLLQGDVGSGKTIVAALAMLRAAENGCQAALMAPTDILAEQLFHKLQGWLSPLGIDVAKISGKQNKREKQTIIERLHQTDLLLVVGTHALIEDSVKLPKLALAVIDEQHRFGVKQRLSLKEKLAADQHPHLLMMSATPIPRSLAMTHYADLDVSVIDERPPGRTPVTTKLIAERRRDEIIARLHHACHHGRQAYWVCPLIEESEALQLQTAEETFATLCAALPDLRIGLLHGKLKPAEKAGVMADFSRGHIQILVATTVIEVGVDVPNASLMIIEHAERFGLAQLHQLRGRIGRGRDGTASQCILLFSGPLSETARARLKVIYESEDGFIIAREDLRIRGPGEFIGARQSGVPLLRYADLEEDQALIDIARTLAAKLLTTDPLCAQQLVDRWLGDREALLRA